MNELLELQGGTLTNSTHMTFCNLCNLKINQHEECYAFNQREFFIHDNCKSPDVQLRESRQHFLKYTKKRNKRVSHGAARRSKAATQPVKLGDRP